MTADVRHNMERIDELICNRGDFEVRWMQEYEGDAPMYYFIDRRSGYENRGRILDVWVNKPSETDIELAELQAIYR